MMYSATNTILLKNTLEPMGTDVGPKRQPLDIHEIFMFTNTFFLLYLNTSFGKPKYCIFEIQ